MKFYRYQGTKNKETRSRYVDLILLQEDIDEYKNDFDTEEKLFEYLFSKYEISLNLREGISAKDLFNKVINSKSYENVDEMTYAYPLTGLFGEEVTETDTCYSLEELMEGCPWKCESDKFLVLYEGNKIANFGDDGVLFQPSSIISVWERNKEQ